MSRKFTFTALAVALGLVAGACSEQADPTSANDARITEVTTTANVGAVTHHVSMGGADVCEALGLPTGCDANFSLVANQKADGSVKGQWQDSFGHGNGGFHIVVDCLLVFGNQAVVGGVVTKGPFNVGTRALTSVVDNGTSANDPPDQLSFSFTGFGPGVGCGTIAPNQFPLFNLAHGQVKVR